MTNLFRSLVAEIFNAKTFAQLFRFGIIGLISAAISYVMFVFCLRTLGIDYMVANVIAFFSSIFFGYNCNKRWTFKQGKAEKFHLPQYVAVYVFSLALSTIFLKITVGYFGIMPELAFIGSTALIACTNFCGIKFLVFKS